MRFCSRVRGPACVAAVLLALQSRPANETRKPLIEASRRRTGREQAIDFIEIQESRAAR
jgi:hypothetical protein